MIGFAQESKLPVGEQLRLYAKRLQIWRLCCKTACLRARACRGDLERCGERIGDWIDAVKLAADRERYANDPETQAMRAALIRRLEQMAQGKGKETSR